MASDDRFKQSVVVTLAKRAANRCSNPDCGAITSGPSEDPSGSINIGEAAHIYGAKPGSARFEHSMESVRRADISNAIWLCGNCHKLIDDDPARYPPGLLFEWQRQHERSIAEEIGKAGSKVRRRYEDRHLEEFGRLSYLAERLLIEKDDFWEYRLSAEVLRFEMAPILQRWNALKRGFYVKPGRNIARGDFTVWLSSKNAEILSITKAFSGLVNGEFARVWGDPGVPGSDIEIVAACRLYSDVCRSALDWEESIRFTAVDDMFSELKALYVGTAGRIIDEAAKLPVFLSQTLADKPESGTYALDLTLSLPEGWIDAVDAAFSRIKKSGSERG